MSRMTQLYIQVNGEWREIDLFDNISIPLTFKVTEIREFGSKTSGYSLDFDIPHTANNAQVFGLNSELDVYESTFEVGKDYPCYLTDNTFTTFSGQFRLKKVIKKNRGAYIYYVGYLYGGSKNFIDELGDYKLIGNDDASKDLDFSDYTTPAEEMSLNDFGTRLNTKDTTGSGWGLTLIDKTNKAAVAFSGGAQTWWTDECTPYLYWIEIFKKIFDKTSYNFVSEFLEGTDYSSYLQDDRWKKTIGAYDVNSIIYPYMMNNETLATAMDIVSSVKQLQGYNCRTDAVVRTATLPINITASTWSLSGNRLSFNADYTLSETNVSSTLNNYIFTAPIGGRYKAHFKFPFRLRMQMAEKNTSTIIGATDVYNTAHLRGYDESDEHFDGTTSFYLELEVRKNGNTHISSPVDVLQTYENSYASDSNGIITLYEGTFDYDTTVSLADGDQLGVTTNMTCGIMYKWLDEETWDQWFTYDMFAIPVTDPITHVTTYNPVQPYKTFIEIYGQAEDVVIDIRNEEGFQEGMDFDPTAILNPKTSWNDVVTAMAKAFNLYIEDVSGKTNYKDGSIYPPNTLRIEPYEIYYAPELGNGQSNIKDWTDKIDWETVEYRRFDDYLYNIQSFTKKQDGDYFNENYNKTYILPYGDRNVKGQFCTSTDKNEIPLNVSSNLCGIVNNDTDTLQCPKVFSLDNNGNVDAKKEYSDGMFFLWYNDMQANTDIQQNYFLLIRSRISGNTSVRYTYYCADTLNEGYGLDTANLNWGQVSEYYQNMKGTKQTYNDLYTAFYKKEYEEKTAPDARIMKANIYLTAYDIYMLQMSDTIVINGNAYHIIEINQWKDAETPTQIELLKVRPSSSTATPQQKVATAQPQAKVPVPVDTTALINEVAQLRSTVASLSSSVTALQNASSQPQTELKP